MKLVTIFSILIITLFTSCLKDPPSRYSEAPEELPDTTNWEDQYTYAGVLTGTTVSNDVDLTNSTWILPQYREGTFSIINLTPPDTLFFIDQSQYTYNGFLYTYSLHKSGNTYKLDLYETLRFGYITGSLAKNFFDAGEFFLREFQYNDIGMNGKLYITLQKI